MLNLTLKNGRRKKQKHWYMLQPNREIWRFFFNCRYLASRKPQKTHIISHFEEKKKEKEKANSLDLARKKKKNRIGSDERKKGSWLSRPCFADLILWGLNFIFT